MTFSGFEKRFKDEEDCIEHLKNARLKEGITCKRCNEITKHYWIKSNHKFQCACCKSRTGLKSGTLMESSNVSIELWYRVMYYMMCTKKPISALEMQRQVEATRYETVLYMMHKIRVTMGNRDAKYKLKGEIEADEGFFETYASKQKGEPKLYEEPKRGRGSKKQSAVLVMVESKSTNQEKPYNKNRVLGYVKMETIDTTSATTINYVVGKSVEGGTVVNTDKWPGYSSLEEKLGMKHKPKKTKPEDAMKHLPWVHTVISNCKREFLGVFHSVSKGYLQLYLNQFCYKLNRRNFSHRNAFDGLLTAAIEKSWN